MSKRWKDFAGGKQEAEGLREALEAVKYDVSQLIKAHITLLGRVPEARQADLKESLILLKALDTVLDNPKQELDFAKTLDVLETAEKFTPLEATPTISRPS